MWEGLQLGRAGGLSCRARRAILVIDEGGVGKEGVDTWTQVGSLTRKMEQDRTAGHLPW